jgi:DNA mismatch endonuclease (patch repair protein)
LWSAGLRGYRLHDHRVPGHPDVVFSSARVLVFVDGCFWHGCEKCYREPKSNTEYWQMKVSRNRDRDARVTAACKQEGWRVVRLWEHEVLKCPKLATAKVIRAVARDTGQERRRKRGARSEPAARADRLRK